MSDFEEISTAEAIAREIRNPPPQPLFSPRRVITTVVLLAAAGISLLLLNGNGSSPTQSTGQAPIVKYLPEPGSRILRQSAVGVALKPGYDGRLTINGVAIPENQMVGAVDPLDPNYQPLPGDDAGDDIRPNNKNSVMFQPGEGRAFEQLDEGQVEIQVRYWRIADGERTARSTSFIIQTF